MSRHGGTRAHAPERLARPGKPRRGLDADGLLVSAASQFLERIAPAAPIETQEPAAAPLRGQLLRTTRPVAARGGDRA